MPHSVSRSDMTSRVACQVRLLMRVLPPAWLDQTDNDDAHAAVPKRHSITVSRHRRDITLLALPLMPSQRGRPCRSGQLTLVPRSSNSPFFAPVRNASISARV